MPQRVLMLIAALALTGCSAPGRDGSVPAPTFARDVAPILFEHCASCHRPGQGTPFSLLEYESARRRASRIARAVSTRHMPPWLPEPGEPRFIGERRLSVRQIATIERWADAGAPEGNSSDWRPAPKFDGGWALGTPDLTLTPDRPYVLRGHHDDVFRNLVLPVDIPETRYVRAVEFQPGAAPVHHAVVHVDRTSASRRRDGADGQIGFDGMGARDAQDPEGHFLGWAPGRGPIVAPDGMPWRLDRGTDLVVELHLMPEDTETPVRPAVGLYFSPTPPTQVPVVFKMGSEAIDIPAGAADYVIEDAFELPVDVDLLGLNPHAHYLGREMRVTATVPGGVVRPLLHIKRWSFKWQQDYRYVTPVFLPRGTTIRMRFSYDNSDGNDQNPHKPPRRVMVGQRSTDEMGNLGLQVVTRSKEDRLTLQRAATIHDAWTNVAGAELLVRSNPENADHRTLLGSSYVDVGRAAEAIPHLELAVRLDPQSANAQNELGGALLAQGRILESLAAFERASGLAPEDDRLHFNVAGVLTRLGRSAEAAREYQRALALNPDYADAHGELGALLFATGRRAQAIEHLARAVELSPDSARLRADLGGALAQAARFDEALIHTRRALELDPTHATARENLARLERRMAR